MQEIQILIETTLKNLSEFCICECKSYCCRKGFLMLNSKEVDLIIGKNKDKFLKENSLKEMLNGKYSFNFENSEGACPQLKNFKCLIHQHEGRPQTCKDFPIFVLGDKIKVSPRCLAKKQNKFFEFEKEAERLGYEIVDEFF